MSDVVIRCRENGPFVVTGKVQLIDHQGNPFPIPEGKDNIALCRCGQSANRPFCDGTHRTCEFKSEELAPGGE